MGGNAVIYISSIEKGGMEAKGRKNEVLTGRINCLGERGGQLPIGGYI